jgi:hypothetical protein
MMEILNGLMEINILEQYNNLTHMEKVQWNLKMVTYTLVIGNKV